MQSISIIHILIHTLLLATYICWICGEENEITQAMRRHEVIPDVVDVGAMEALKITFDSGAYVNQGDELTPTQVQNEPALISWHADANSYYTLVMTEPDAPSRKDLSLREWLHWMVVNIPEGEIAKGKVLFGYQGSGAAKGSGLHRYVYLLFKQPQKVEFDEPFIAADSISGRSKFATRDFVAKYNLGPPVAVNFFQAQYDEYSDVILARLGMV